MGNLAVCVLLITISNQLLKEDVPILQPSNMYLYQLSVTFNLKNVNVSPLQLLEAGYASATITFFWNTGLLGHQYTAQFLRSVTTTTSTFGVRLFRY